MVHAYNPITWKAEAGGWQVHNFWKSLVMPVAGKEPVEQSILSRGTRTIEGWSEGQTGRVEWLLAILINVPYLRAVSATCGRVEDGERQPTKTACHARES